MEEVIRQYRFGDMIFAYSGPVFTEPELVKPFRVTEKENEAKDDYAAREDFATSQTAADQMDVTSELVVRIVSEEELLEKKEELKESGTYVLFEKDDSPFYVTVDNGPTRTMWLSKRLKDYLCWNVILGHLRIPQAALKRGGSFLHSSMISVGGKAVLFTAEKQVGKSTQASLWKKFRGTETINGDRSMIYPECESDANKAVTGWLAASTPFCGTSKIAKNEILPLGAIVILSRAGWEGTEEGAATIRKANPMERVRALFDGCTFKSNEKEDVERIFALVDGLSAAIPFYKLFGTLHEDSVGVLECELQKDGVIE